MRTESTTNVSFDNSSFANLPVSHQYNIRIDGNLHWTNLSLHPLQIISHFKYFYFIAAINKSFRAVDLLILPGGIRITGRILEPRKGSSYQLSSEVPSLSTPEP